ncbi:hypothetical protein [Streptomyces sp. NPDC012466]|jgi:hypothetical protein|uniref:hypothetical protein n=1 Tax=Streptomyces sp. NPDC012466 TaxID=3364835 RepID=UPI0036E840EB
MAGRRGARFAETLKGTLRLDTAAGGGRPVILDLRVSAPGAIRPHGSTTAVVSGRVRIDGWADDPHASGSMLIAPLSQGRIGYHVRFTAMDGHAYVLEGHKSPTWRSPLRSMTILPIRLRPAEPENVTDRGGARALPCTGGEGLLRFRLRTLPPFAASWRFPAPTDTAETLTAARRGGTRDRLNVWYSTFTDPNTGTGFWLHHELVRPLNGSPYTHGWAAAYPPEAPPVIERFGPHSLPEGSVSSEDDGLPAEPAGFRSPSAVATAHELRGRTDRLAWDLTVTADSAPLHTFPRLAWKRRVLPAVHIVPQAQARYRGSVRLHGQTLQLSDALGASARIAGRGNAHHWAWLHADLDDDTVLEVVTAVSGLPVLRHLPPIVFLRLRRAGRDWPRGDWRSSVGVLGAGRFRARPQLPTWTVQGRAAGRRIAVRVHLPEESRTAVTYTDPDGSRATCHNSERADVHVSLERRLGGRWQPEQVWDVRGTAHAEVGLR